MSIQFKILGKPGRDNALFLRLNSGTKLYRILFDCGENIFNKIKQSDVKAIDYLFFSHLHIDHAAGFDYYFRRNFDREKPNFIFGPEDTAEIIHNRLKGFKWNLIDDSPGEFIITDITEEDLITSRFVTSENYKVQHSLSDSIFNDTIIQLPDFKVKSAILNHSIPSIGYSVVENDSLNIDKEALLKTGLTPGSWLEKIRDLTIDNAAEIKIDNKKFTTGELRKLLLKITKGESICYLTDFLFDDESKKRAEGIIKNCDTMVCESQYHSDDFELAEKNFHLTSLQAAELAKIAGVKKLFLFHISERYSTKDLLLKLLTEAREIFPETYFPDHWEVS